MRFTSDNSAEAGICPQHQWHKQHAAVQPLLLRQQLRRLTTVRLQVVLCKLRPLATCRRAWAYATKIVPPKFNLGASCNRLAGMWFSNSFTVTDSGLYTGRHTDSCFVHCCRSSGVNTSTMRVLIYNKQDGRR